MVQIARQDDQDEKSTTQEGGAYTGGDLADDLAERTFSRRGWRLILHLIRGRGRGLGVGVAVGLAWTAAKVSTGLLVRNAVDQGIIADDAGALRRWALILGCVAVASATFTGLRRWFAFRGARSAQARLRYPAVAPRHRRPL